MELAAGTSQTLPPRPATPAQSATGLPLAAIESPRFADAEDRRIWTAGWVCVGTVHTVAKAGQILPYTVGNQGIHVARREDGGLVARFNKAPHGGCRFVPLQCQTGTKTKCTFTSCGYSRDRGVMHEADAVATHQYLGLRPERLLTIPLRTEGPLIFVNLGQPAALAADTGMLDGAFRNEVWAEYPENWKELPARLFGRSRAKPHGDWLAGLIIAESEQIELRWLFPNLIMLRAGKAACAIILQPTALRQTLARISGFGEVRDWHETIRLLLRQPIDPAADAARFLRSMVDARMEELNR